MRVKIGEFAKLGNVSVRMLRHYDKIDLLKPAFTDQQTGFRYYEEAQLATLHHIRDLQSLGFSLKQVQSLCDSEATDDALHKRLWEHKQALHTEIASRERQIKELEFRMSRINRQDKVLAFTVKSLPAETVICADAPVYGDDDIKVGFAQLSEFMRDNHITITKAMGIRHSIITNTDRFVWALQVKNMNFQRINTDHGWELTRHQFSPQMVASAVIRGSFAQSLPCTNGFEAWANFHNYALIGASREVYIRLVDNDIDHPDNLMEIQYPIRMITGTEAMNG